ncbi:hypothetical protein N7536_001667 [Penicillium majusculum]|nr:hypothetical protein N7536_001667 [Penicillium majusculum]
MHALFVPVTEMEMEISGDGDGAGAGDSDGDGDGDGDGRDLWLRWQPSPGKRQWELIVDDPVSSRC